jgi:hypothetical protein
MGIADAAAAAAATAAAAAAALAGLRRQLATWAAAVATVAVAAAVAMAASRRHARRLRTLAQDTVVRTQTHFPTYPSLPSLALSTDQTHLHNCRLDPQLPRQVQAAKLVQVHGSNITWACASALTESARGGLVRKHISNPSHAWRLTLFPTTRFSYAWLMLYSYSRSRRVLLDLIESPSFDVVASSHTLGAQRLGRSACHRRG